MPLARKLLFLGLDGLDRDLLVQWNLTILLQREHGPLEVPIVEQFEMPLTPSVWASFLTGEMIDDLIFKRSGVRGRLLEVLIWLRQHIPLSLGLGPRIRRGTVLEMPKLERATMIDIPSVAEINAPFYSYDNQTQRILKKLEQDEVEIDQVADELYAEYTRKKQLLIRDPGEANRHGRHICLYALSRLFGTHPVPESIEGEIVLFRARHLLRRVTGSLA